jgi:hypothetical protein
MQQISDWLKTLGMSEYVQCFAENGIEIEALPHLTDQDLKDIGVLLGHRRVMLAAIGKLTGAAPDKVREHHGKCRLVLVAMKSPFMAYRHPIRNNVSMFQ